MNDEVMKAAVRQFLKSVNATAQREIEKVVRNAVATMKIPRSFCRFGPRSDW